MIGVITTVVIGCVAAGLSGVSAWFYAERGRNHRVAKDYEWMSQNGINVPRRPSERLTDWAKRIHAAANELSDASTEFIVAASKDGIVEPVGERAKKLILPAEHPASIRLERARGREVAIVAGNPYRDHIVVERPIVAKGEKMT